MFRPYPWVNYIVHLKLIVMGTKLKSKKGSEKKWKAEIKKLKNKVSTLKNKVEVLKKKNKKLKKDATVSKPKIKKATLPGNGKPEKVKEDKHGVKDSSEKNRISESGSPIKKIVTITSNTYNVKDALSKLRSLKSPEEVLNFTQQETRLSIKRLVPTLVKKLSKSK